MVWSLSLSNLETDYLPKPKHHLSDFIIVMFCSDRHRYRPTEDRAGTSQRARLRGRGPHRVHSGRLLAGGTVADSRRSVPVPSVGRARLQSSQSVPARIPAACLWTGPVPGHLRDHGQHRFLSASEREHSRGRVCMDKDLVVVWL